MSLNFDKNGRPIAIINDNPKIKKTVYLTDEEGGKNSFKFVKLTDGTFMQTPNTESERDVLYIFGPSGAGKSTYIKNYTINYKKVHKNNPLWLISALATDDKLDSLGFRRITIDNKLIDDPLTAEDFTYDVDNKKVDGALIVFDDVDVLTNALKKNVYDLINMVLKIGRHFNLSVIVTNHDSCSGRETKSILNESQTVTYFPHAGGRSLKYLLNEYLDLTKEQIHQIKQTKSRFCTIFKNYPKCAMCEKLIFILQDDD